jgi:hypothetical protein
VQDSLTEQIGELLQAFRLNCGRREEIVTMADSMVRKSSDAEIRQLAITLREAALDERGWRADRRRYDHTVRSAAHALFLALEIAAIRRREADH